MWVAEALEKIGGKVEDRDAFIDAVLKTELTGSPLGKTVKLDAYGNPIYDVQIRKVVKRADGKYWNVPIDELSERFAILEIRSRDLHEAAALFADLPGHQEEPDQSLQTGAAGLPRVPSCAKLAVSDPILTLSDVVVAFDALACGRRRQPDRAARPAPRHHRSQWRRQDHAVQRHRRGAAADGGPHRVRWPRHHPSAAASARPARRLAHLPDHQPVSDGCRVQDNMVLALRGRSPRKFSLFGTPDVDATEGAADRRRARCGPDRGRADVMVKDLSYGEQRQLEIALSLVTAPRLLLLDEPAAGLSPSERSMVAEIIRSLERDITVVLIEHDMDLALGLVDLVTCMFEGRVLVEAVAGRDPAQQAGAGSLSGAAASCLRFAICTAAMARRMWSAASRSTSAPARSWPCSAATAWARPR